MSDSIEFNKVCDIISEKMKAPDMFVAVRTASDIFLIFNKDEPKKRLVFKLMPEETFDQFEEYSG